MTDRSQIAALQRLVDRLRRRLAFVEGSRFWKLRSSWMRIRKLLGLHAGEEPPALPLLEYVERIEASDPYARWLLEHEPRLADSARLREAGRVLRLVPEIAVIVDDVQMSDGRAVASVRMQAYEATTLLQTSSLSTGPRRWERFNAALAACRADIIAFCEPTSILAPHATFEIALAFNLDPSATAVYGDWDRMEADGSRSDPVFAPDWSPETFLSDMFTGRVIFYRREAVERCGGFRAGCGSALHYDLALRILDDSARVAHRPAILVHEVLDEAGRGSTDGDAAERVLAAAIARRGEPGRIVPGECAGVHIVRYSRSENECVQVIVPTRDLPDELERCLESVVAKNRECELRVTIVDNGSVDARTVRVFERFQALLTTRLNILRIDEPFNYSRLINAAVRASDAPYLLFLNNDAYFKSDEGIAALCEQAKRTGVGAVGARLLYEDGTVQHAGVVVGIGGLAGHVYRGVPADAAAYLPSIAGVRNYSAVTAACMMVRRSSFVAVAGFDERLAVEFNDIDFCLKLRRLGLRNVYLPHVVLRHDESLTRGKPVTISPAARKERELFRRIWSSDTFRDPYYNPNLTLEREDVSIAL